jgi:hypothetical protein
MAALSISLGMPASRRFLLRGSDIYYVAEELKDLRTLGAVACFLSHLSAWQVCMMCLWRRGGCSRKHLTAWKLQIIS